MARLRTLRSVVLLLVVAAVVSSCRAPTERRLVSIREGELEPGLLRGDLLYVETRGVRQSAVFVHDLWEDQRVRIRVPDGYADSPAWSPDGSRIALSITREEGTSHIWIVDDDGANRTQVTSGEVVDDYPRWSPDGDQLVFASIRDGDYDWRLFVVSLDHEEDDGGALVEVGSTDGHSVFPDWSPDGRVIVYSNRDGDVYNLRLFDVVDRTDRQLTETNADELYARFSPDGRTVVYATNEADELWQLWIHDLATDERRPVIGSDSMDEFPAWSPDGAYVAFSTGHLAIYRSDGQEFPRGRLRWAVTQNLAWSADWRAP